METGNHAACFWKHWELKGSTLHNEFEVSYGVLAADLEYVTLAGALGLF